MIEGFLRSWEIAADLDDGLGTVKFTYKDARVIDRNPLPGHLEDVVLSAMGGVYSVSSAHALTHVTRRAYPEPPKGFDATAEVLRAYARWRQYKQGGEHLQQMAQYVLTGIEKLAGEGKSDRRKIAARILCVDPEVLNMVGTLAELGDERTARKVPKRGEHKPLTPSQHRWLDEAVKRLIQAAGRVCIGQRSAAR